MTPSVLEKLIRNRKTNKKAFAVLIDPDKTDPVHCHGLIRSAIENRVDFFFIGGSLIVGGGMNLLIRSIKEHSSIPVVLFPGSNLHIDPSADAILFLSLISGRNPDYLIGQHVIAAPILKKSQLEILSTGYMLIDSGKQTTVSYISNTTPIPYDKPDVAACTAMAGEMLGMKLIYLDSGSGAQKTASPQMIATVRRSVDVPVIVGGGITSAAQAVESLQAGADLIVVGNGIERNPDLLPEIAAQVQALNQAAIVE
ncbi:geranylgeranylglyceryl/heptaprenylglyceryl phosphate synthase [Cytophagaceae bacterium YF14B1]|uniref:Geranylgeranylglyceryl phosphate synthase n=1 Tax=Xanthocytophaga flava TaxID=3048013 RepID=A0AAE3U907_9BACT|nr:geranylgeranylglyceryl/heptaprenylglyceryl phosphate synthase [Xanthocytophaga flavus]MDJ1484021.1 geranylgeranylglyceryl/heptaprenylglyceryl phosphate synthase [Xanthocytophaga flavus]